MGREVFRFGCGVQLHHPRLLQLTYDPPQRARTTRSNEREGWLEIELDKDIQEMRFYVAPDDVGEKAAHKSFLAFKTSREAAEQVNYLSKKYNPNSNHEIDQFIVVEFNHGKDLEGLRGTLQLLPSMAGFVAETARLNGLDAKDFCASLVEDSRSPPIEISSAEKRSRTRRAKKCFVEPEFLRGKKDDDAVLTFPFAGDKDLIEKCSKGLQELSAFGASPQTNEVSQVGGLQSDADEEAAGGRGHYLIISAGDCRRLAPGVFLNDTLIDFFMRWYV